MKKELSVYDNYPAWMIVLSAGLSISIYALGIAVVAGMGWWILTPYLFLSVRQFDWIRLVLMAGLVILAFPGNGLVRGRLACCHCRQRELGCPAERLFQRRDRTEPTCTG